MESFIKYNSIDNHYDLHQIERFEMIVPPNERCIFKEKVHGANLQIIMDDQGLIQIARRSGLLEENENFYGAKELVIRLTPQLKQVYAAVQALPNYDVALKNKISICGEIFGGGTAFSKTVNLNLPAFKAVQKGVNYCSFIHFYAFDVRLIGYRSDQDNQNNQVTEEEIELKRPYLSWTECERVFDAGNIFRAETLHVMTAREVTHALKVHGKIPEIPSKFPTTLPKRLGEKELPNNFAEGYVIVPENNYFSNGGQRMIFKYKNDSFAESIPTPKVNKKIDEKFEELWLVIEQEFLAKDILLNRLNNVLSHEGLELTDNKERGKIVRLLHIDLLNDIQQTHLISSEDVKELSKKLGAYSGKFIQSCVTKS